MTTDGPPGSPYAHFQEGRDAHARALLLLNDHHEGEEWGWTLKQAYSRVGGSAMCVQKLDDSRSAIRITYRISLRSSSMHEPRYPLPKVVCCSYVHVRKRDV